MSELLKAITKTKNYADKYGQKLNANQLFLRLISPKIFKFSEIKKYEEKEEKNKEYLRKLKLTKSLIDNHLVKMKSILMVGITGSVAAEKVNECEDIDLLIICRAEKLWWLRLYLRLYVWQKNIPHRRYNQIERKDEFCFNMWLDENNLKIPKEKQNLKNATDLIMMKVIYNKNNCYQKFLSDNKWVSKYLATGYGERIKNQTPLIPLDKGGQKNFLIFINKIINRVLFWGQYLYMWSKKRRKLKNIKIGQAFFHQDN